MKAYITSHSCKMSAPFEDNQLEQAITWCYQQMRISDSHAGPVYGEVKTETARLFSACLYAGEISA